MEAFIRGLMLAIGGIVLVAAVAVILCLPLMWTWNYVMPYLFGFKTLTWSQAWCLNFVSGCIFRQTVSQK